MLSNSSLIEMPVSEKKGSRSAPDGFPQSLLCQLFRVKQFNDIHERAAELRLHLPLGKKRLNRIERIRKAGALFIHVPKNGGTSVCNQLYGCSMMHQTLRYYQHVTPDLCRDLPSFAIWRDPVERFVSAWAFARKGGTSTVKIHPSVNDLYKSFHTLDDAISHVESQSSPYAVDHVFRPQSWYVCQKDGTLAVDTLFPMEKISQLPDLVPAMAGQTIPHLNQNPHPQDVTAEQIRRIRRLYEQDEALRP
ncbi:sulfotransferase family protein [Gluconobacter frateurii]|uniref:sulfotransferase family 2 domain-containing protein n=1 Tax=Gluconobacter frateurii TaxID=38308 RepID=UPI001F05E999|nr:sulfotransferase family 2 domain-containing protein [Gluconobacter frateurii]UMM09499.1 sulfotransferase family protein [Gluconobacter frateurii]